MHIIRFSLLTVFGIVLLGGQNAGAQQAARIVPISGNGQVYCPACANKTFQIAQPIVVQVLDSAGRPINGKVVDWSLVYTDSASLPVFATQTTTDQKGLTSNTVFVNTTNGTFANPFIQTTVQAVADGAVLTVLSTMGLTDFFNRTFAFIGARLDSPDYTAVLEGTTGGTSTIPVRVHVDAVGKAVPNASVRILNGSDPATSPSAKCATAAGADVDAVMTDVYGDATCNIVFGPIAGSGRFSVLVGGVDPSYAPEYYPSLPTPVSYWESPVINFTTKAAVPASISISSGNGQSINPGQQSQPLVVAVTDSSGSKVANATVAWSITPSATASISPTLGTTNAEGLSSAIAALSSTAAGTYTVRATVSGTSLSTSFTLNANVVITGLQKVSGDAQTAPAGQSFGQPLVVQVNGSNNQPVPNLPVTFTLAGPGTLSSGTANTNASGRAQVTVTAANQAGNVVVTASAGAYSQTFNLTVIPPGPVLSTNGFVNGADFQRGSLSPCSIVTIIGQGIAPNVQGVVVPTAIVGPLPYQLANVRVAFGTARAPIYNVANVNSQQQVTVQVPCDVQPGNVAVTVTVSGGSGTITIPVLPASPGIFLTTMSDNIMRAVALRPDGSFVSIENPARRGEIIRTYVTGLGLVTPSVGTNSSAIFGADSTVTGQVIVGVNNGGTQVLQSRLASGLVGVQEITFVVPQDAPAGNDIVFSVGINAVNDTQTRFSAGTRLPIL